MFPDLAVQAKRKAKLLYLAIPQLTTLQKLCPFLSNGVMRVGGRLANANMPFKAKHPAIPPRRNFLTTIVSAKMALPSFELILI